MKKILVILLCATFINAGRTSQWSSTFMLKEPINTILNGRSANAPVRQFDVSVRSGAYRSAAVFFVTGISPAAPSTLRIFAVNGALVADLSAYVRPGQSTALWSGPNAISGVFMARLQNGARLKTVKFFLTK